MFPEGNRIAKLVTCPRGTWGVISRHLAGQKPGGHGQEPLRVLRRGPWRVFSLRPCGPPSTRFFTLGSQKVGFTGQHLGDQVSLKVLGPSWPVCEEPAPGALLLLTLALCVPLGLVPLGGHHFPLQPVVPASVLGQRGCPGQKPGRAHRLHTVRVGKVPAVVGPCRLRPPVSPFSPLSCSSPPSPSVPPAVQPIATT